MRARMLLRILLLALVGKSGLYIGLFSSSCRLTPKAALAAAVPVGDVAGDPNVRSKAEGSTAEGEGEPWNLSEV